MGHYYNLYGLRVKSEIELPEAYEIEEQATEVEIRYGIMPEFIREKKELNYNKGRLLRQFKWFYVKEEGNFLIENGTTITVELETNADEKNTRIILLGACFGSILYQREMIAFHGSAVVWRDKAIIISGNSGAGKSTISAEFRKRGALFLADDTVSITSEDEIVYANPGYPQQKLCADTATHYGYDLNKLILINEGREKFAVRLNEKFCPMKKEIAALVCLDIGDVDQLCFEEITGNLKLEYIINNLYTYSDCKLIGMNSNVFKKCLEIAEKVPIIRVVRPPDNKAIAQIAEYIIQCIESKNKVKEYK